MDNRERDFLNRLKSETEDIKIPESLKPDMMEQKLESMNNTKKHIKWKKSFTVCAAAACCLIVCGAVYGLRLQQNNKVAGNADSGSTVEESEKNSTIKNADSYEDIYAYIEKYQEEYYGPETATEEGIVNESAAADTGSAGMNGTASSAKSTSQDTAGYGAGVSHSETNIRQEGVDEEDIVKTDGRYIYTLTENGESVTIVDTKDGLRAAGEIKDESLSQILGFYVKDKKIILVGYYSGSDIMPVNGAYWNAGNTKAVTYDITNPDKPEKMGEVTQSGTYTSSRMEGDYLYLFSQYYADTNIDSKDPQTFVPAVNGNVLAREKVYLPSFDTANMYEVVTSVNIQEPGRTADSKAIFSKGGDLYVSNENIFWYETFYGENAFQESVSTYIRKLSYKDGKIEAVAQGEVAGYINDSFSIDEYKGYLRVITTSGDMNHVYVMDGDLKVTGTIKNLAEDERVYSARLLGDTGYFVTFRETDPLFSVDFSNPEEPKILGELKIPGFSDYLHFYGEDQLLGIGMEVDEKTGTTGGVKLSMFDISDNTDVKETHKYVMDNVYSADVLYDYKAVLIDAGRNLIGLSANEGGNDKYYIFTYDAKNGFECRMKETINGSGYQAARGVYIDDTLYVVKGNIIEAYSLEDYKKTGDIIL